MLLCPVAILVALAVGFADDSKPQEGSAPSTATAAPGKTTTEGSPSAAPVSASKKSPPASPSDKQPRSERATFGAGCFWHVEDVFERLKGVNSAVSGYAGGAVPYPSYEMVHEGTTGHAEVVMVDFNPDIITYEDLLKVFWKCHDPTSIDRQGPDEGPQYRSVIFYHSEEQRRAALRAYRTLTDMGVYRSPIVTQLLPMRAFYRAEDYHQDYYGGKPRASSRRRRTAAAKARKTPPKSAEAAAPAKESASGSAGVSQAPKF